MRHLMPRRAASRGVTLVELMVGLAIGAMLLVAAAPFYGDYVRNSRLREAGNTLLAETMFAQSEAIKRNATVKVTLSGASIETRDMTQGAAGTVIRTGMLATPVVVSAATTFDIGSDGRPKGPANTFTSISVNLGISGTACSSDVRCPGLRMDAGGGTRLCGNHQLNCN